MPTPQFIPEHSRGTHLSDDAKHWFYNEVKKGRNPFRVGEQLRVSRTTVRRLMKQAAPSVAGEKKAEELSPAQIAARMRANVDPDAPEPEMPEVGDPITDPNNLPNKYAHEAWHDFGYFRVRYFNRRHIPWQVEMCQILMGWMELGKAAQESGDEISGGDIVKGALNTPPGGGKTTTVSHDFPAWLITRNRNLRVGLGSRTTGQAEKYVRRLRNSFEKNVLLNLEYGRYKPLEPEVWRKDQFIVDGVTGHEASLEYMLSLAGFDHRDPRVMKRYRDPEDSIHEILASLDSVYVTGEKEPTVSSLSQEMGFLGGRYELNLWDDLCDRSNSRTPEQRESLAEWWFAEAESRCEPGGLVALIGTRFGKYDLYRHCRDLTYSSDEDVDEILAEAASGTMTEEQLQAVREDLEKEMVDRYGYQVGDLWTPDRHSKEMRHSRPVYFYHRFPAHDDHKCQNPGSMRNADHVDCVLDPKRFNYRFLMKKQASDPRKFNLTYQQIDEATEENLVQQVWLTGGVDKQGIVVPGCYNYERRLLEIPKDLKPENCFSIATVDPSAQNWWSLQWWVWDAVADVDYLINLLRIRLSAGNFLDWNRQTRQFQGVMNDWQIASVLSGWPISLWIVESNAAQRYLFQYRWVKDWMKETKTLIKGHETGANKADADYGVETVGPRYRQGLVDLPFNQQDLKTRVVIGEFAKELTEWPDGLTEDMVMGHWFLHFNRYRLSDSLRADRARKPLDHPYGEEMPDYVKEERRTIPTVEEQALRGHQVARLLRQRYGRP